LTMSSDPNRQNTDAILFFHAIVTHDVLQHIPYIIASTQKSSSQFFIELL
jgi:hypothetical protein